MFQIIKKASAEILDLLYPPRCPVCDGILDRGVLVCPECEKKLPYIDMARCFKCGKPVQKGETLCRDCEKTDHVFDEGIGVFLYDENMRKTMAAFKYKGRKEYGRRLGALTYLSCRDKLAKWRPDVIVPIPLHPDRYRTRGYNQAAEIASEISERSGIPMETEAVIRTGRTKAMKTLGAEERRENMARAFGEGSRPAGEKRVLLVDDIYTTGSTMDAVSTVLKDGGTPYICFLAVCIGGGFMVEY